jgi:hypothetical protein
MSTGHPSWGTVHIRSDPDMPEGQGNVAADCWWLAASLL